MAKDKKPLIMFEAEYAEGHFIRVSIVGKAPVKAKSKADVVRLEINGQDGYSDKYYTPGESINIGTGLIYAANHLLQEELRNGNYGKR